VLCYQLRHCRHSACGHGVLHLHGQPGPISTRLHADLNGRPAANVRQNCRGAARHLLARLRLGAAAVRALIRNSPPVRNHVAPRAAVQRGGHHASHQLLLLHAVAQERLDGDAFQQETGCRQLAARVPGDASELPRGFSIRNRRHHPIKQRLLLQNLKKISCTFMCMP